MKQENAERKKHLDVRLEAGCWWSNRTLIHPRPFPACLTWLQWRPGGGSAATSRIRSLCRIRQPVSSVLLVATAARSKDQLVFEPAAFSSFPPQSPRACRQEDLLPQMQYYIYTTEQKVLCPSSPSLFNNSHCRSFQNNRMYYLIRVPEKVFFAFIFFHLVLIVSFFVYVLNYYASTNPAAFGMLKNWKLTKTKNEANYHCYA